MTAAHQGWTVPGWYTDPSGRYRLRYHDGAAWSPHVFDDAEGAVDDLPLDRLYRLLPPATAVDDPGPAPWGDALLDVERCSMGPVPETGPRAVIDEHDNAIAWVSSSNDDPNSMAKLTQIRRVRPERRDLVGPDGSLRLRFDIPVEVFAPEIIVREAGGSELGRITQQTTGPRRFAVSSPGRHQGVAEVDGQTAVVRDAGGQPAAVIEDPLAIAPAIRFLRPVSPDVRALLLGCFVGWDTIVGLDHRSFDNRPTDEQSSDSRP